MRAYLVAAAVLAAAAFALAQVQTSTSTSQKGGQASATASAKAGGKSQGSGFGSGSAIKMLRPTHAILYEPGPNWIPGKLMKEQPLQDHGQYMAILTQKGVVLLAGPWTYEPGGMALIRVQSDAEAQAVLDNDPGVRSGVLRGVARSWEIAFQSSGVPSTGQIKIRPPG